MKLIHALLFTIPFAAVSCATAGMPTACSFRVETNVPEAMVYVDDVYLGRALEWASAGRMIQPGFHRVELRHPDHYSSFDEAECPAGSSMVVKATLRPVLE